MAAGGKQGNAEGCMEEDRFAQALEAYFPRGGWSLRRGASGMNNTTRFVEAGEGGTYVLRIYETHRDADKVAYEHAVLLKLAELKLPFRTPVPVRTAGGRTMVRLGDSGKGDGAPVKDEPAAGGAAAAASAAPAAASVASAAAPSGAASPHPHADAGKIAALFRYMEGENPVFDSLAALRAFGRTAGRLSRALAGVRVDAEPVYRPYYELDLVHPQCTLADAAAFCAGPPAEFAPCAAALAAVGRRLEAVRRTLDGLRRLPHQLVHGDLNASNCLADSSTGEVTAVLDFEFVTRDLRVMEPAVCLSDLIDPSQPADRVWPGIEAFLGGFGESIRLDREELEAVPALVMLRRLDVFIHFLGRWRSGLDSAAIVAEQIRNAAAAAEWLDANGERLSELCGTLLQA